MRPDYIHMLVALEPHQLTLEATLHQSLDNLNIGLKILRPQ